MWLWETDILLRLRHFACVVDDLTWPMTIQLELANTSLMSCLDRGNGPSSVQVCQFAHLCHYIRLFKAKGVSLTFCHVLFNGFHMKEGNQQWMQCLQNIINLLLSEIININAAFTKCVSFGLFYLFIYLFKVYSPFGLNYRWGKHSELNQSKYTGTCSSCSNYNITQSFVLLNLKVCLNF